MSGAVHDAPPRPLTIAQAHIVMQEHRDCVVRYCGCKGAAFQLLVEVGHIRPDSRGY
jgi:hypothetical protein